MPVLSAPPGARKEERLVRGGACLALATLLLATGCGPVSAPGTDRSGGGASEAPGAASDEAGAPVVSRPLNAWVAPDVEASVALHRVDDAHMVAVLSLTNNGSEREQLWSHLADPFGESGNSDHDYPWNHFSGIAWLDPSGRALHKPYHLPDRSCLCSAKDDTGPFLDPGGTQEAYSVLAAPPADVSSVTVVTGLTLPFVDVPIGDGAPEGLDYRTPDDHPDAAPESTELVSVVDSPEQTVVEGTEATEIHLSTDVLFEVNESTLTDEATQALQDAAARIDASGAREVLVEGHTDSTGDDAINNPLSVERAEAVRDALADTVASDVEFTTVGHGSGQPIADNGTEEGRQRNRRVTVTVDRTGSAGEADLRDSGDPGGAPATGDGRGPAGVAVSGRPNDLGDAEVEVALTDLRALTPETALLSYTVTNPGPQELSVDLAYAFDGWMEFRYRAAYAVALLHPDTREMSLPLRVAPLDSGTKPWCLCSSASGTNLSALRLGAGQTREYYAILPVTPGSTVTDVQVGRLPLLEDVAIRS
ncbi:OmpA family protein [Thermobifida halotolerans]|uniref:OmpA family protein n=1 Tax=Thermobifida halotolerans TaxID=483545 RepID=A0AA97M4Y4_9ACTN|nr:OmpA family protein [Thermobifida halotolerans]UOE20447.1 OmpA family protein [Thermobifida halotolerans]